MTREDYAEVGCWGCELKTIITLSLVDSLLRDFH